MFNNLTEIVTGIIVGIGGGVLAMKKMQVGLAKGNGEIALTNANQRVIEMMRQELDRMSKVNQELAEQVNKFQLENIQLSARLQTVTLQMTDLQHENAALGQEIQELRGAINEFKSLFAQCKECPMRPTYMEQFNV